MFRLRTPSEQAAHRTPNKALKASLANRHHGDGIGAVLLSRPWPVVLNSGLRSPPITQAVRDAQLTTMKMTPHLQLRGRAVLEPVGVLDSARSPQQQPARRDQPRTMMSLRTATTPEVSRARRSAVPVSSSLLAKPDSCTVPLSVST